jgi:type VI secretion system protein ImpG
MFNKYYQDELTYLRELGREFSRAYPEAAKFLGEAGSDPDVERMLEGFAFLSGRLRQKLDDGIPELTQGLIDTFWPHYLMPIPAMAIVQFEHLRPDSKDSIAIRAGTPVESVPVDGTRCRFKTIYDVRLLPLRIVDVTLRAVGDPCLSITLKLSEGLTAAAVQATSLRLHLTGSNAAATALLQCLTRHCRSVTAIAGDRRIGLVNNAVQRVGFSPSEALLASSGASFSGFILLMDYFSFPQKFHFVDITDFNALAKLGDAKQVTLEFALERVPTGMPQISMSNFMLGCTPVVNLFEQDADPIALDLTRSEYQLRPAGENATHRELHSVRSVSGLVRGQTAKRNYRPHFHGGLFGGNAQQASYVLRRQPAVTGDGYDNVLAVRDPNSELHQEETLSIELLCTNRRLTTGLGPGDINVATTETPTGVRLRNINKPTMSINQPLGAELEWRLLAHLSLNYRALTDVETLRSLIDLYNVRAHSDQQARQTHRRLLDSIEAISSKPATALTQGIPVRGVAIELTLNENNFDGEGDMFLFASILDEFMGQYVGLNSFSRLTVRGLTNGDVHERPARLGQRPLL